MSILRGSLRMQRLGRDVNKLANMPNIIARHELDWLAFEIIHQESQDMLSWHITGQYKKATEVKVQPSDASSPDINGNQPNSKTQPAPTSGSHSPTAPLEEQNSQADFKDLLLIRERLAHLTGHTAFSNMEDGAYQK